MKLASSIVTDVRHHLDSTVAPSLSPDFSSYAKGRKRAWLNWEASLNNPTRFTPSLTDKRLWDWLTTVWNRAGMDSLPELGLAIHGEIPIQLHRDASYAAAAALNINLGGVTWLYDTDRGIGTITETTLDGGEIIPFDCKHRHGVSEPDADRWSIILWRISHKARQTFEEILS